MKQPNKNTDMNCKCHCHLEGNYQDCKTHSVLSCEHCQPGKNTDMKRDSWIEEFDNEFVFDYFHLNKTGKNVNQLKAWISDHKKIWEQEERERVIEEMKGKIKKIPRIQGIQPREGKEYCLAFSEEDILDFLSTQEKENS